VASRLWKKKLPSKEDKPYHERNKITDKALDNSTIDLLIKLLNTGVLKSMDYPVSTGKEAVLYRATDPQGNYLAVKIFKYETSGLRHMEDYIRGDPRFDREGHGRRAVVKIWASKEFANLKAAYSAKIPCPKPYKLKENVVIMQFMGQDGVAYAILNEVVLSNPKGFFRKVMDAVALLYSVGLVHADLSQYNLLVEPVTAGGNLVQKPILIDWGQAVVLAHPMAKEFLKRDVVNLCAYFSRLGVDADPVFELEKVLATPLVVRHPGKTVNIAAYSKEPKGSRINKKGIKL
jgi:RIO kinase 1